MKIDKIVRKDDRSVTVHLDNDDVLFLANEIFLKNGLRKGDDISEGLFSSLIKENRIFHLKQKAFRYLGRRPHSVNELRLKLRHKDYDNDLINEVIGELTAKNYLNDYDFAIQFADENIKNKLWGEAKVKAELMKKGIDGKVIDRVLSEKFSERDVLGNAVILLKKKFKTIDKNKLGDQKTKFKLASFLANKGYDYDIIRQAIDECLNNIN